MKIVEATEWLDQELQLTEKYTSENLRKLNEIHSQIEAFLPKNLFLKEKK